MSVGPLGIFGGTFNPIHNGHLRSVLETRDALGLSQVSLIPSAQPPLRDAPDVDAASRADMVEFAIADEPGLFCDRRELSRSGPSYTYDTLATLRSELGPERSLCLILGTDHLDSLDRWHRWQELLELAHVVVMARPGWQVPEAGPVSEWLAAHLTASAETLQHRPCGAVLAHEQRQLPISGTEIREMIATGHSPRYLLPDAVWTYIQERGLYGTAAPQHAPQRALEQE